MGWGSCRGVYATIVAVLIRILLLQVIRRRSEDASRSESRIVRLRPTPHSRQRQSKRHDSNDTAWYCLGLGFRVWNPKP